MRELNPCHSCSLFKIRVNNICTIFCHYKIYRILNSSSAICNKSLDVIVSLLRSFRKQPNVADTSRMCVRNKCWGCCSFREEPPRTDREETDTTGLPRTLTYTGKETVRSPGSNAEDLSDAPHGAFLITSGDKSRGCGTGGIARLFSKLCLIWGPSCPSSLNILFRNADVKETLGNGELAYNIIFRSAFCVKSHLCS